MTNLVDIIMPLYNGEAHVEKAVTSVLEQTYRHWRLFVVNDGSTDNSLALVRKFSDPRVFVVTTEHEGVAAARNRGLATVNADWVCFLDSDDYWLSTKLEEQTRAATYLPKHSIVYCDTWQLNESGQPSRRLSLPELQKNPVQALFRGGHYALSSSLMVHGSLLAKCGGFQTDLRVGEDWHYWLKLVLAGGRFVHLPKTLTVYRTHSKSLSQSKLSIQDITHLEKALKELFHNSHAPEFDRYLAFAFRRAFYEVVKRNDAHAAHYLFHRLLQIYPRVLFHPTAIIPVCRYTCLVTTLDFWRNVIWRTIKVH